jgi:SAM-dependent methyltransferase
LPFAKRTDFIHQNTVLFDLVVSTNFIIRTICPACNSGEHNTIYSRNYLDPEFGKFLFDYYAAGGGIGLECLNDAKYILDECCVCGLIYQREVPNDALMTKLYEEWMDPRRNIEDHERTDDLNYFSEYAHEIMRIISYFNRIPSTLKILDFGMGLAKWALMAKAFGCDVYGTELSVIKRKRAEENGIKVIDLDEDRRCRFDFINVDQVVEHIREPLTLLSSLKELLKHDGLIKVCVPDGGDIKKRLQIMDWKAPRWTANSLHPVHPLEHVNCFCHDSLIMLSKMAGLEVVHLPKAKKFPLLIRNNPLGSWHPKDILKSLWAEWRYNFNRPATYLFLRAVRGSE